MKVIRLLLISLLTLFFMSCEEKDINDEDEMEFVAGEVLIGIKPEISIDQVFDWLNSVDVFIDQMSGFHYYSDLTNDSLAYVINQLKPKPYLSRGGFEGGSASISTTDNRIIVKEKYFEMGMDAQQDWLATEELLKLHDLKLETKYLLVKVEPGTEKRWMRILKHHPYVSWVDLNWLVYPVPF